MKFLLLLSLFIQTSASFARDAFSISRPCCSLAQDPVSRMIGVTRGVSHLDLTNHVYRNTDLNLEGNGLAYTCNSGYIDLTHLRDTADWTFEAYLYLKRYLGKEHKLPVKKEGGKRSLIFKKQFTNDLTEKDKVIIAANISYEISVWHEIATGFRFVPLQYMSAFSPEDNFSNYLGTHLASKVLLNELPFNVGMTEAIEDFLIQDGNTVTGNDVLESLSGLRNIVWEYSMPMTDLLVRNTSTYENVFSFKTPKYESIGCSKESALNRRELKVVSTLSNGKHASDYYELRVELTKKMIKRIRKTGVPLPRTYITQKDHKWLIPLTIDYINLLKD